MKEPNRPKSHVDTGEIVVLLAVLALLIEIGWSLRVVFGLVVVLLALVAVLDERRS